MEAEAVPLQWKPWSCFESSCLLQCRDTLEKTKPHLCIKSGCGHAGPHMESQKRA